MKYLISIFVGFVVIVYLEFFSYAVNETISYKFDFDIPKPIRLENWNKKIYVYPVFDVKEIIRKKDNKEMNNTAGVEITIKDRGFCINQECYKILSIMDVNNVSHISLFSLSDKKNIYLNTNTELVKNIKFKVKDNVITLIDMNSSKEFKIDYFDVNLSKYKPKENKKND